jgi:hypothetical protein
MLAVALSTGCAGIPHGDVNLLGLHSGGGSHCECADQRVSEAEHCEGGHCDDPASCEADGSDACTDEAPPFHGAWASAREYFDASLAYVGHIANFWLPPTMLAPPEIPPPGRFHPVPTRPVFAGHALPPL